MQLPCTEIRTQMISNKINVRIPLTTLLRPTIRPELQKYILYIECTNYVASNERKVVCIICVMGGPRSSGGMLGAETWSALARLHVSCSKALSALLPVRSAV